MAARGRGSFSLYIYIENFKNLLVRNHWTNCYLICRNIPLVILYQDCSSHLDLSKNMAARGWGLFSLYIFIENLKNLLVRNHWSNFIITWQKCFHGDPVPRLFKYHDSSQNMAARGWGLFSLCIYIKNFKNFLLRNLWTEFNVTWQECCFGDPLPRLFKPS